MDESYENEEFVEDSSQVNETTASVSQKETSKSMFTPNSTNLFEFD